MASSNTAGNGTDTTSPAGHTCRNCQKETTEPFKTTCICKKTYCPECKEKEPQAEAQCQTCTEQFSFFKVVSNVRCQNVTNGCEWVGPPKELNAHIKQECRHCPCEHCHAVGLLSNIQGRHMQRCHSVQSSAGEGQAEKSVSQFRCSHGCSWVGRTRREQRNHNQSCQLRVVKCSECQTKMPLPQKKVHRKTCPYVNYKCPYCGVNGQYTIITGSHLRRCKGVQGTRQTNLPASSVSPEGTLATDSGSTTSQSDSASLGRVTACPYAQIGCPASVKPEELEEHKAKSVKEHLDLAMQVVHSLQMAMERMQQQIPPGPSSSTANLPPSLLLPPRVFQLTEYSQKCKDQEQWFSPAFYSSVGGYKMCLRIDASGDGDGRDTHTSVFLCIMKGEYDDRLPWPFYGEVTIDLLNQLEDHNHYTKVISFSESTPQTCGERVVESERSRTGFGFSTFVTHQQLELNSEANIHYLKEDCLFIRVRQVTVSSANRPWLTPTN